MTHCPGDGESAMLPLELYEKLTAQGDQVRSLKRAKADKVSYLYIIFIYIYVPTDSVVWFIWYLASQIGLIPCFHNAEIFSAH